MGTSRRSWRHRRSGVKRAPAVLLSAGLWLGSGCAAPLVEVAPPGGGEDFVGAGPFAVGGLTESLPRGLDGVVEVTVRAPLGPGPFPVALWLQEPDAPVSLYLDMAEDLAAWGVVVALPHHPLAQAGEAASWSSAALRGLERAGRREGHPLAGQLDEFGYVTIAVGASVEAGRALVEREDRQRLLIGAGAWPGEPAPADVGRRTLSNALLWPRTGTLPSGAPDSLLLDEGLTALQQGDPALGGALAAIIYARVRDDLVAAQRLAEDEDWLPVAE